MDETGFVYRIEWLAGTKSVELQDKDGKVLASQAVSENKPEVKVIYPNGGEVFAQGEKIKIRWQASDQDGDVLTYSLSLSSDNGQNWLPVDIDIKSNEYQLDTSRLSEGDYLIKVRAIDGVNTAEDVSDGTFKLKIAKEIPNLILIIVGIFAALVVAIVFLILKFGLLKKKC